LGYQRPATRHPDALLERNPPPRHRLCPRLEGHLTTSEKSERQTFWNEFFDIFGIRRRTVAAFEEPVRKLSSNWGYIDLFWPARVLVEHKSAGQCLDKAHA
jgi:hypothetical protein